MSSISYKIRTVQTIYNDQHFLIPCRERSTFYLLALEATYIKTLKPIFYVAIQNLSPHYKFHISWRSSKANYFPSLQFFVFTCSINLSAHSSHQPNSALHFNQSASTCYTCTYKYHKVCSLSSHSSVILDECLTKTFDKATSNAVA